MNGYKVFNSDWTWMGVSYAVGETTNSVDEIAIYDTALSCLTNVSKTKHKYAEVEAVRHERRNDHYVTNELTVVREISRDEFNALCTGTIDHHYIDGTVFRRSSYVNAIMHGEFKEWYPTGELKTFAMYNCGVMKYQYEYIPSNTHIILPLFIIALFIGIYFTYLS